MEGEETWVWRETGLGVKESIMVLTVLTSNCQLSMEGDIHCEASYYNERLSLWEPLLEPLEGTKGDESLYPWTIQIKVWHRHTCWC